MFKCKCYKSSLLFRVTYYTSVFHPYQSNVRSWIPISCIAFISTDAVAFGNAHFGAGSGTIHLHVVGCTGGETNLTDCPEVRSSGYCLQGHSEDAGVRCQGLKKDAIYSCNLMKSNQLNKYECTKFYSECQWKLHLWSCSSGGRLHSVQG